jgi:FkbM family methyltransferase
MTNSARTVVEGDVDLVVEAAFFSDRTRPGVMVEVGAAKPEYLSISAHFRSLGWRVISIEPNPVFCELHRQKGFDIIECACGESDRDDVPFFVVHTTGIYLGEKVTNESWSSLGFRGKYIDIIKSYGANAPVDEIKVKVRRLDTILREHAPNVTEIDIIAVDVEGWELDVLNGLSFDIYRPKVLIIENFFTEQVYVDRMVQKGYALWKRLPPNDVFVRKDLLAAA